VAIVGWFLASLASCENWNFVEVNMTEEAETTFLDNLQPTTRLPKPSKAVELCVWEKDLDKPGYIKKTRHKTFSEVYTEFDSVVKPYIDEYCSPAFESDVRGRNMYPIPPCSRIACWAVPGSNEGDYVHIDLIMLGNGERTPFAIIKTFNGNDYAWELAKFCANLLWCA
jgi:hypothetical protein